MSTQGSFHDLFTGLEESSPGGVPALLHAWPEFGCWHCVGGAVADAEEVLLLWVSLTELSGLEP